MNIAILMVKVLNLKDTEALPIPYYNNPEDYSSIMSVLKSRKK